VNGGLAGLFSPGQPGARARRNDVRTLSPWRTMPRRESRFQAGVTSTGWWLAHRKVSWSRAPRIFVPLEKALVTTGAYEGSLFAEGVSVRFKVSPFTRRRWRRARSSSSVSSCTASTEWIVVQRGSGEGRTPSDRRRSTTGTSEVRSRCRRGKKTPTPRGSPVRRSLEDLRSSPIHRSVHRGVKPRSTSGPRKRRRVVPQSSTDRKPESTRDAGFRLDSLDGRSRSVTSWQATPSAKAAGNEPV
jgi:hypothetical protein